MKIFANTESYDFVYLKSNNFMLEGITSVPQTFILDKKGNNIYHHPTIFEGSAEPTATTLYSWINSKK